MLSLDPTTRAEMDAAATTDAKAQAVLAALSGTVAVRVYNDGVLVGSGTMAAPWAARAANVVTIGEVTSFTVTTGGNPSPATWYLRFESGSRWLRGSFGLSGADFTWSLPTWAVGQSGEIGTVTVTSPGGTAQADLTCSWSITAAAATFNWNFEQGAGEYYDLGARSAGETVSLASLYTAPAGAALSFSLLSGPTGVSVDQATGAITFSPSVAAGTYDMEIDGDLAAGLFEPAISGEPQIEQYWTDDSGGNDGSGGPTWSHFISHLGILWKSYRDNGIESTGDYIGLDVDGVTEVPMSGNPFSTAAITGTVNVYGPFSADVTTIIRDYVQTGENKGLYLVLNTSGATIKGRLSDAPPTLSVQTSTGQDITCPVRFTARWAQRSESLVPRDGRTIVPLSATRRAIFGFDLSGVIGTVTLATMNFQAMRTSSSSITLRIFKADPPTFVLGAGAETPQLGLSAEVMAANPGLQERQCLFGHPDVLYAGDFTGTTLNLSAPGTAIAPAHLFNGGTIDTISQTAVDRAVTDGVPGAVPGPSVEILDDPDAPGTRMWRGQFPITQPSWSGAAGDTWKSAFDPFFSWTSSADDPLGGRVPTGGYEEIYCRAYFYLEPEWREMNETAKIGLVFDTRFGHWTGTGWEPDAGNGGIFSDGRKRPDWWDRQTGGWVYRGDQVSITGQDLRSNFRTTPTSDSTYPYAFLKRIQSYFYNIDNPDQPSTWASEAYWNPQNYTGANAVGTLVPSGLSSPGYPASTAYGNRRFDHYPNLTVSTPPFASVWKSGRWYCFEQRVRLNTIAAPFDVYGNGEAQYDGLVETWINGVKVESVTGWRWRRHPAITIRRAAPLLYHGGASTTVSTQQWFRINHCAAATRYIGPRVRP